MRVRVGWACRCLITRRWILIGKDREILIGKDRDILIGSLEPWTMTCCYGPGARGLDRTMSAIAVTWGS